ncbi:hypothetical protein LK542_00140 [Massilia sp. IC2-477]|uniref:hypothetical protein n=1 Tax=unclassified Massilia TaxID=2609279 RepID=UPI001D0F5AE5|nr:MULTISPECIES: hypothetical protein [unclassified Massilia]MCC2954018.1 hypothetical protein [Massilia sp. IC2-477]MCC2971448.1 hypothetical protein [Massilia sp. IC2-476]
MASESTLAARREALVARCADQRALLAYDVATLSSPDTLGLIPAYALRHRKTALIVGGVAAGLFLTKPKWAVGSVTAVVSAYKLVQRLLPVLRWRGFEVH